MSFARFMELALYDPERGYYGGGAPRLGAEGDYVTAVDSGHAFGRCVARQLAEIDAQLGRPDPFDIVEFGAGRGLLARDVLDSLTESHPQLATRVRYVMVDRSGGMRETAGRRVPEAECIEPESIATGHHGVVIAVELFDALPVHRLRRRSGRLSEIYVDVDAAGALVEQEGPPSPAADALAERYGAAAQEGSEAEVAPAAAGLLEAMAGCLERGVLLVVDYGDAAGELYGRHPDGTLLAYAGHKTRQDLLARVGNQDLTAHVNFSALEDRAAELGLAVLGRTTQDRFLVANGILEAFEQPDAARLQDPAAAKRRLQAMQLIHPEGMGRRFKVLVLSKGCEPPPRLAGLIDPF